MTATTRRRATDEGAPDRTAKEEPIHTKYRPRRLKDVLGQDAAARSISAALASKSPPHCYLLTGPSGTGKTTLARIISDENGVSPGEVIEIDAASNSGIDDMKAVLAGMHYQGFGDTPNKAVIVDECHRLSKQAWDSMLKMLEETPAHVYVCLCTTEPDKVPAAIVTRCSAYHLKPVRFDDLMDLLEVVCDREGFDTPTGILSMVAQAAGGSPRQALTMLAAVHACDDANEAAELLAAPLDNKEIIDLCRALVKGDLDWGRTCTVLKGLAEPPETIRIIIVNYLNAVLTGRDQGERDTVRLLAMLERFLTPCNQSDKLGPLLVAFGRFIYP